MSPTRRDFLQTSVGALGAVTVGGALHKAAATTPPVAPAVRPMRLLVLGGTGFIGPYVVRYALYRGHTVSIFNRGRSKPHLFPEVEKLVGDRDGALDSLRGKEWDAVIDNTGYVPRHVRDSCELLKGHVGRYLFTSTGSVYQGDRDAIDEDSPLLPVEEPEREDWEQYYGPLKVLCEQISQEVYGPQCTIVRPHVVAGPEDFTNRFSYWPVRIDHGGEVIGPGDPNDPVQYIDVRDLSEFMVHLVERDTAGVYNGAGPHLGDTPMAQLLYGCRAVTTSDVSFTWIDKDFLKEREARFPLWYALSDAIRGYSHISVRRGVAAGLTHRPIAVTARDTLEWLKAQPQERQAEVQLNLERDKKILEEWHAAKG